ncbi:MAG: leucine-rich repeat domain-containing protein [Bacteroidales bacterium]|nr:leucine-rich repeat domain-containing protein [Bacteroidales bacterium]
MTKKKLKVLGFFAAILMSVNLFGQVYGNKTINGVKYFMDWSDATVIGCDDNITSIVIPSMLTYSGWEYTVIGIEPDALAGHSNLISIVINANINTIKSWTFYRCSNLKELTLPNSVQYIEQCAFAGCSSLKILNYNSDSCTVDKYWLNNCDIYGFVLPNSTVPLETINIGKNVRYIPKHFLGDNKILKSIVIPNSVETIADSAFYDCGNLEVVKIGNGIKTIGKNAFKGCNQIDILYCMAKFPPKIKENTFDGVNKGTHVFVGCDRKSLYEAPEAMYWNEFTNIKEDCSITGFEGNNAENALEEITDNNSFSVYPNPANDEVVIRAYGDAVIFNAQWQTVKIIKNINGFRKINISGLESGVYYIKCGTLTKQLIVK